MQIVRKGYRGSIFKTLPTSTQNTLLEAEQHTLRLFQSRINKTPLHTQTPHDEGKCIHTHLVCTRTRNKDLVAMLRATFESLCLNLQVENLFENYYGNKLNILSKKPDEQIVFFRKARTSIASFIEENRCQVYNNGDKHLYLETNIHLLEKLDIEIEKSINNLKCADIWLDLKPRLISSGIAVVVCLAILCKQHIHFSDNTTAF